MENAKRVISFVTSQVSQKSSSKKDEITVMKALMNDPQYKVDVYDNGGKCGEYYPGKEFRKMITNVISNVTKMPKREAAELVDSYDFGKSDASIMVQFSKEFVNTYLQTGRKLPLGGRETSSIELEWKNIEDRVSSTPVKRSDGTMERVDRFIPAHGGIKVSNSCPKWVYDRCEQENTK